MEKQSGAARSGQVAKRSKQQLVTVSWERPLPRSRAVLIKRLLSAAAYRRPMKVSEYILYRGTFGRESVFFLCPRCNITMEREYQRYCDRCGQRLNWNRIRMARCRALP